MTDISTYGAEVGQLMREAREARGMSLDMVQRASQGRFRAEALRAWEKAERSLKVWVLAAYADWLGVSITSLLPPEKPPVRAHRRAAASAAQQAVAGLTGSFRSVGPDEAAGLLTDALRSAGAA